jgi:hypothetical protein
MPSPAATKYKDLAARASIILKADRSRLGRQEVQAVYGAAFVAQVAAWNAYVSARLPSSTNRTSNRFPSTSAMRRSVVSECP